MQTHTLKPLTRRKLGFLTGFQSIAPQHISSQTELLTWLSEAHARTRNGDAASVEKLFQRYRVSAQDIAQRGHELADFSHRRWEHMQLFGPRGSDVAEKTAFFQSRVRALFQRLYPKTAHPPEALVHVTCTGYSAPSGAQDLVSLRGWGQSTQVIHAYHMGCYAAHPAIRIALGLQTTLSPNAAVDMVHTELCSLHLDPAQQDPAQLIIQSLFADGFIRYQLQAASDTSAGLEVLAARDEILPDSSEAMHWTTGPLHFTMGLSKAVPVLLASALPRFVATLFEQAGLNWAREKTHAVAAVHPGGPRIIELSQKILGLEESQVRSSRAVLRHHGNMSSATLPHIWQQILLDPCVPNETLVVSLGAGPGLTLSGMLLKKRS